MKKKILSLALAITLIAISVSVVFPTIQAATDTNLFKNGDFSSIDSSTGLPTGWIASGGGYTTTASTTDKTPDGQNSVKFTADSSAYDFAFFNEQTISIKKNTEYTISYWVKNKNVKGMRFYMYETDYTYQGSNRHSEGPREGENIYTYTYQAATTRVIRTDVAHRIVVNNGSNKAFSTDASMAIVRHNYGDGNGLVENVLTSDYPSQNGTDEWVQIVHTFKTGNKVEHEAEVRYAVYLRSQIWNSDSEVSVGGFVATAKSFVNADSNDYNLGYVEPSEGVAVSEGDKVTFTATPLSENNFDGWYNASGNLLSSELEYTFTYHAGVDTYCQARFSQGSILVENAGFETGGVGESNKLAYFDSNSTEQVVDSNYTVGGSDKPSWMAVWLANTKAHSGNQSLYFRTRYHYAGRHLTGLEKNTDYAVSFWTYCPLTTDGSMKAYVIPKSLGLPDNPKSNSLGYVEGVGGEDAWQQVSIKFNTGDNTDVTLWFYHVVNSDGFWVDDISVYKNPVNVKITAASGGTATATKSGYIRNGSKVTFTATPNSGNTFLGWYDESGNLYNSNATFAENITNDINITAKFEGYNIPAVDIFKVKGWDGTFEDGTVKGWYVSHPSTDSGASAWAAWNVSTDHAYRGTKSLKINTRHHLSVLPITGLQKNTDYKLSYYVANFYDIEDSYVIGAYVVDSGSEYGPTAQKLFATTEGKLDGGTGWHKVELFFNTGEDTDVNFVIYYSAPKPDSAADQINKIFVDNMTLMEYVPNDSVVNGDFENGVNGWLSAEETATEGGSKALKLAETGDIAYQTLKVETGAKYKLTFRAKGDAFAAVYDLAETVPSVYNSLSSLSYCETSGGWSKYEIEFYSSGNEALNIGFRSTNGEAFIDDVVLTKQDTAVGSIVEQIDFESDRFAIASKDTDTSAWEIYEATSENDPNVVSGTHSLHFKYDAAKVANAYKFNEAYTAYSALIGATYEVTAKYKIVGGIDGGSFTLTPESNGNFAADVGFEQSSINDEWQTITFVFNNNTHTVLKTMISSIEGLTTSDIYIDDIVVKVVNPIVGETNSKNAYCEDLYNAVENGNFEDAINSSNWANMTSSMKVITDKSLALKGSNFLRASKGTSYALPVKVDAGKTYYFGASLRGTAASNGFIGLASENNPKVYFNDATGVVGSQISVDKTTTGWRRNAFSFVAPASGYVYVVIECTAGYIDIDSVMLFKEDFTYKYDPNDYSVYYDYDYDATDSSTCVINGGFGAQPYWGKTDKSKTGK